MNNWFFTGNNGLNFSTGAPVNIPGGQIVVMEGASAISDKNGQLLFYTDGITVWNKNHAIMANGQGLAGGYGSSTQSCIIVPKTKDEKQYYIFTADEEGGSKGFQYSIVDITLNSGLGGLTIKNQLLVTPCSEKVTAIRHCNKKDYWVITHKYGSDAYYAYLATENGVDPNPVITHTGSFIPVAYGTMAGALKSSPDGKRIVAVHPNIGVELSDFNNQTGIISNTTEIFNNNNAHHYGAEFSASSKMLYVFIHGYWYQPDLARHSGVFQYDLSLPTITAISNSKFEVFRYDQPNDAGSMQRGPNGKIYLSQYRRNYLSVINSPEIYGSGCNFVNVGISLPADGEASLPNLLNDYGTSLDTFQITNSVSCINTPVNFSYTATGDVTALQWDFGDLSSGTANFSAIPDPVHIYSAVGTYNVRLIKISVCGNDTLQKTVTIGDVSVNLGSDTAYCGQQNILLDPHATGSNSYLWQNGFTTSTITTTVPGLYWVEVKSNSGGCTRRDSIVLISKPLPVVNLGRDSGLCINQQITLDAQNAGSNYLWNNNTTNQTLLVNQSGLYWVKVTSSSGCSSTDTIIVRPLLKSVFTLGPDQSICAGQTIQLKINLSGVSYLWQDGSTSSMYNVNTEGSYFADVTNQCGTTRDSIVFRKSECVVYVPNAFTPNNDGKNDYFRASGTGSVTEFEMNVYNRWGQLIFATKDKSKGWNGTFNSMLQPDGIYVWTIRFKTPANPKQELMKGTVMLIR